MTTTARPTVARAAGNFITLDADFTLKDLCKRVPGGRWEPVMRRWQYPATPSVAQAILDAFRGTEIKADPDFRNLVKRAKLMREAQGIKSATDLPPIPFTKTQPWLHQLRAYHFAYPLTGAMLALDLGCGKSKCAVDLFVNRNHRRGLFLAPLSVIQEWPTQFATHAGKAVITVPLDDKAGTVKDKMLAAKMALHQGEMEDLPVAIITNYEAVWREPWATWGLKQAKFDFVCGDELHRIQAANGKASKYLGRLADKVPWRLGLTGTPFSSGPLSIYGQYRFLDKGVYGTSNADFKKRYATTGGYGGHQIIGFQNESELQSKFYSIAFRVESRDVLDLPDEQHIMRYATLSPAAAKAYKELEQDFITRIKQGEITVNNALTKLLRLQQMTSGFARLDTTDEEEGQIVRIDREKQKLLKEVLTDIAPHDPVVVFARFTHDLEAIAEVCKELGRTCAFLDGKRKQLVQWRDGEYDDLAVQIRAGSTGVTMVRSHYCLYYSLGFSLADYKQSLARTMRPGQKHPVTYVHLLMKGTVDTKVYNAIESKQEVVSSILSSLR